MLRPHQNALASGFAFVASTVALVVVFTSDAQAAEGSCHVPHGAICSQTVECVTGAKICITTTHYYEM